MVAGRFMGRVFEARRSSSYRLLRTNIGLAGRVRYPAGDMLFSATAAEFLENYHRDTLARWSADDLAAQREFVNAHLAGRAWLDWSTPAAALQLVQAGHTETALGTAEKYDAVVLAGPVVELLEPARLFAQAVSPLRPGGRLVGIVPCLRDNSPENEEFMQLAATTLWPYVTAEELLELLGESVWQVEPQTRGFIAVPRFNEAVLQRQLGFKGFARIFEQLMALGYDPMEVGWGELRFVATVK